MKLSNLLEYDDIIIQCHNFPDADTIASGYALSYYFTLKGKRSRLIYGGPKEISKPNLVLMTEKLGIPIEYVKELNVKPQLLVTVDCVHGESNVANFDAYNYAAIDHHASAKSKSSLYDIRSNYGSCSSIMAILLKEANIDYNDNVNLATALYYGLYTDTNGMKELSHPADRDLRDFSKYDKSLVSLMINSNLSLSELRIAADALSNVIYQHEKRYAITSADECDPNILGFINDLLIKVDSVDVSVVCTNISGGIKFSVRSCIKEINAADLSKFIAGDIGSGGGHNDKAGGFISFKLTENTDSEINVNSPVKYFENRIFTYCNDYSIIDYNTYNVDLSYMNLYKKKRIVMGYVLSTDIYPPGTSFCVRTLEADIYIVSDENIYIMISFDGSIYPIDYDKFKKTYTPTTELFIPDCDYSPGVFSKENGYKKLLTYARSCVSEKETYIYATKLERRVMLYTKWDENNFMSGKKGDYLVALVDDLKDMYIVSEKQFSQIYEPSNKLNQNCE